MLLSVVVPCHNEEDVLADLVREVLSTLEQADVDVELVLVDDGSRDDTVRIMRELHERDPRCRFVSFSRNFGKEAAMLAGLGYAQGDAVVIMDADLQHPPHLLIEMLRLHGEGYDQVIARRTREGDAFTRTVLSRLYYRLVNAMVDVNMQDGAGDFRLLSRRAVDSLLRMREYNRFSKGLFSWIGFPTITVDYHNVARQGGGESKWTFRRLLNYGLDGIMSFNNAPLRLSIYIGAIVTGLSFVYVIGLIVAALMHGVTAPGYVTLIAAITGMGGLQLLFLGVIGEYVGRIYYEAKRRPHYLVAETEPGAREGGSIR
ncbi:glycosyltransferase [Rhodococcus spelaei]|uniref:Glycosyltransferase n=1 Tax=Rhodococcus spelaei TaxID=2546320 RepID=A0A541BR95_9NOCA|nr:glycosyltransferase family 2 protein [Rhodococcus spelaei]TQF74840.1 glycosyltransferase [Rhodococcus spelaei]